MSARKTTQKTAKGTVGKRGASKGFSAEERDAMKERARELKAEARGARDKTAGTKDVLAKIAEMRGADRTMATKLHEVITATAPGLTPRTWYGMPAYAREGKVVVFFQSAQKFNARYATLGFSDQASLDDGVMWPTSFALAEWNPSVEKQIAALVKRAAG